MDKFQSSYAQVRLFARKKEDGKFQQVVFVKYKIEELIYLLDVMNSVYEKFISNQPICNVLEKVISSVYALSLFFIRVKTIWNIGDYRKFFLKLKSKLGLYLVVLTTLKCSPEKITLTVVEMQQLPDIDKTDSKEEISCLKGTLYIGRKKVCVNVQTDKDKLIIVVYRYWNSLYHKNSEIGLKLTEYLSLLAEQVYLFSYIDIISKRSIVLDEATVHN